MVLTLWQFFKIIISPTCLISCQHVEKINIDKVVNLQCCSLKEKEKNLKIFFFFRSLYVGNFSPTVYCKGDSYPCKDVICLRAKSCVLKSYDFSKFRLEERENKKYTSRFTGQRIVSSSSFFLCVLWETNFCCVCFL